MHAQLQAKGFTKPLWIHLWHSTTWAQYWLLLPSHWTTIIKLFPVGRIPSSRRLSERKKEKATRGTRRQHSMIPAVKPFEKLLLTPCPALCKTTDLLRQQWGDLTYKIIFSAYCLAFSVDEFSPLPVVLFLWQYFRWFLSFYFAALMVCLLRTSESHCSATDSGSAS